MNEQTGGDPPCWEHLVDPETGMIPDPVPERVPTSESAPDTEPIGEPGVSRPSHPTWPAAAMMIGIIVLLVVIAAWPLVFR